jgi:hypothetical protein
MSAITVDVSDFVNVGVAFTPLAVPFENFGTLMIMGDSNVIDVTQRYRQYSNILQVGSDFSNGSPEYLAAELFFSQSPQPSIVYIGRWASSATAGLLHGAQLTATQQTLTNFTAITSGSFHISIDGVAKDITGLNFSASLNLNGVASIIQSALVAAFNPGVTCTWDANYGRFNITSSTTGATSSVSYGSTISILGTNTDSSTLLGLTSASGASAPVPGMAAETALSGVEALANASSAWYGLMDATTVALQTADYTAIAAYILASSRTRIFGTTIQNTACLDPTQTNDLASTLQALNNKRVFWIYSGSNKYAVATMFGRGFTVDFTANNSAITLAYKQAPGLVGENLNETQFATLIAKGGSVNIKVNNGAVMLWNGQMSNGYWFDEVQGVDWLQNQIQTDVFNLLYTITTKVPQTDQGSDLIANAIAQACEAGIHNGLGAPGVWNAAGFGMLAQGGTLSKGYYIYYPPVATQAEADRMARKSVPFQVAFKLAGAVQTANITLNVNP